MNDVEWCAKFMGDICSEVATLFDIVRDLKRRGVGMIYISHKLDEVFQMSDRITVLRDGQMCQHLTGTNFFEPMP